jgi:CRP-like cAMP-binding protein
MLLGPEETIIRQNDEAGDIFVIYKGECVVYVNDSMYVKTLYPGMIFGECATLLGSTRTATVKTESFLILGRVDQGYFTELLNRDAAMHAKFV